MGEQLSGLTFSVLTAGSVARHRHLDALARQGVLLLNTSLTVRAGQAGSHQKQGWEKFTDKVVDVIDAAKPNGVVFLAWGAWAQKRVAKLDKVRCLVCRLLAAS